MYAMRAHTDSKIGAPDVWWPILLFVILRKHGYMAELIQLISGLAEPKKNMCFNSSFYESSSTKQRYNYEVTEIKLLQYN